MDSKTLNGNCSKLRKIVQQLQKKLETSNIPNAALKSELEQILEIHNNEMETLKDDLENLRERHCALKSKHLEVEKHKDELDVQLRFKNESIFEAIEMLYVKQYNVLLLGELTGKSNLINSMANYVQFDNFEEAKHSKDVATLIPGKLAFLTDCKRVWYAEYGDKSDFEDFAQFEWKSTTTACQSYLFHLNSNLKICFIDTPGLTYYVSGDETKDASKLEQIANYIANFEILHAIWIVAGFHMCYYLPKLFQFLGGLSHGNVRLVRTEDMSQRALDVTFDTETRQVLRKLKREIPTSTFDYERYSVLKMDNLCFRHVLAIGKGLQFCNWNDRRIISEEESQRNWQTGCNCLKTLMTSLVRYDVTPADVRLILEKNRFDIKNKSPLRQTDFKPARLTRFYEDFHKNNQFLISILERIRSNA